MLSEEKQEKSLSWADRPLAELMRLTWPIAVSMVSYSVMTLVDTLFLSRLGAAALAGASLGGITIWTMITFPMGLLQGAKVLVSQEVGAGRRDSVGSYLGAALTMALALGLPLLLVSQHLVLGLLPGLTATEGAATAAVEYFGVRSLAIPAVLVFFGVREVRYGLGDSRWPMAASLVANAANVGLNYLLIFVWGWGVAGAAWGTVAATLLELALLLAVQSRDGLGLAGLRWSHLRALWSIGLPTGLQFVIEMGSFTLLTVMVSRYSEAHMAAHQITLQVIHFSFLPAVALGEACSVMVGQAVGALREQLVRRVARLALWVAGVYAGAWTLVFALGGRAISAGFTDDPELTRLTVQLLAIAAVFQVFDAANIVGRSALRGTGDVRFPAVVGVGLAWLLTPPGMWLLGYQLGMGAAGGWIGLCVELVLGAGIFWWRLEREDWRGAMTRARALRA